MSGHRLLRLYKFLWFVVVGMILTHIGYYFRYDPLASGKSSVSERRQEKTTDTQMYNQSVRLYSAFIDEEYNGKLNESAKNHPLVHRQIIVIAWQTENVVKETFKCCILQGKNHVMTSKPTRSHQCCYNMGLLRARRTECPLVGEFSKLTGVSLAKWNMSCPTDKLYYITPTVLDPVLKKNKWAVCNKYFYGPGPNARRLVEWFEIHRFVGVDKFTIHYESTLNSATKKVLQFYQKKGLAEVLHIGAPFKGQYESSTEPLIEAPKNMYMPSRMKSGEGTIHANHPAQGFTRIFLDPESNLNFAKLVIDILQAERLEDRITIYELKEEVKTLKQSLKKDKEQKREKETVTKIKNYIEYLKSKLTTEINEETKPKGLNLEIVESYENVNGNNENHNDLRSGYATSIHTSVNYPDDDYKECLDNLQSLYEEYSPSGTIVFCADWNVNLQHIDNNKNGLNCTFKPTLTGVSEL
ncbi:uncharacterized protein LOC123535467 [Mercenaria mercenaria]|uniref:uncharacterized protein LOC123535467 n=1 Tax=Mercenaria mercenaria TaxID=6596 RepID=UPI00234EC900|nr:uncharacterized protein LOC123535467 [Mercenaria mercenaria]